MAAVQRRPSASRRSEAGPSSNRDANSRNRMSATSGTSSSQTDPDAKILGQWRMGRTIGKGSSGRVKVAKHHLTGQYAAVKIVPKGLIMSSRLSMNEAGARADRLLLGIEREIVIMKLIDHPNVLSLYDVWETNTDLYLIMEYVPGGELFDYLVKRGRLPPDEALHYFQQIIYAVDYCHRFNICHRDLKPENLLLDKDKNIKVADFGMAAWQADERMLETSCGSPHYASPEIVAGKAYNGSASDIWSCGIILFALLTGRLPFDDDNIRALLQKVKVGHFDMPDDIVGPARDLLFRMLEKDPEQRITMAEIISHTFFQSRLPRLTGGRRLPAPPSLADMARPVSAQEIDPDILSNLKTLWHGATDSQIYSELMSSEKTWEKAIYHLLVKYRNRHLENYNMDDDEDSDDDASDTENRPRPHDRPSSRNQQYQTAKVSAERARITPSPQPQQQIRRKPAPLAENESYGNATPPPRPQAPTPKKAAGDGAATVTHHHSRLAAPARLTGQHPAGPRSPVGRSSAAPAITLQEATPVKDGAAALPAQVTSRRPLSPTNPGSPLPPPPQVGPELHNWLYELSNQVNEINIRSSNQVNENVRLSTVSSNSANSNSALQTPEFLNYMAYMSAQSPVTSPTTETAELGSVSHDFGQFADADDDETEATSLCSVSVDPHATARIYAPSPIPQSPITGLGLGAAPRAPSRNSGPPPVSGRWSQQSSQAIHRPPSRGSTHASESPAFYTPSPGFNGTFDIPTYPSRPPTTTVPLPAVPPQTLKAGRSAPPPPPKNASRPSRSAPPPPRASVRQHEQVESMLARDNSYVMVGSADDLPEDRMASWGSKRGSGFSAQIGADGFGNILKKRRKVHPEPVDYSISSSSGSINGPRTGWFTNMFAFKPAPVEIRVNSIDISEARDKTRRALISQNARVSVVDINGVRGFKVRMDDSRGLYGEIVKAIKFRVEFTRAAAGSKVYTSVSLSLEKGAQSSFKAMYNRLQETLQSESVPSTPTDRSKYSSTFSHRASITHGSSLAPPIQRSSISNPTSPKLNGVALPRTIR
ncbi:Serine/threonine-protein kinase HSL1 [Vanrija pseudolonga]|uniref:non-specific serine/threonine protein kinase n=1 Tax=Vanrija pseudolonga TaxID=143232 RepID=A0AAF0YGL6_9TREE|nr:Serine/threonine-protein kinase HSL1 [Vanrija pseudolonga]